MAESDLKDFTVNWIIGGLLLFSLLSFAITFMYDNNSTGLSDGTDSVFDSISDNVSNKLDEIPQDSESVLNDTANTNPEISDLGSRDTVTVGYETKKTPGEIWEGSKVLLSWVFSGDSGDLLLAVIGGLIGFMITFYIWRFIRGY